MYTTAVVCHAPHNTSFFLFLLLLLTPVPLSAL
jgi:hypothetical protein